MLLRKKYRDWDNGKNCGYSKSSKYVKIRKIAYIRKEENAKIINLSVRINIQITHSKIFQKQIEENK